MSTGNDVLYKLLIANEGVSLKKGDSPVTVDGKKYFALGNASKTQIMVEKRALEISLYKVDFHRKMYEPGHIEAVILIQLTIAGSESFSVDTIKRLFFSRRAALSVSTTGTIVAYNYYVYSLSPELSVSTTSDGKKAYDIYTKLDIFSLDKLLTLNKFSKAYLGQRLVSGIVDSALKDYSTQYSYIENNQSKKSGSFSPTRQPKQRLIKLRADSQELIHPYLVQYNESLYDFAARVANRCGEAMYFERGGLCFGLPLVTVDKKNPNTGEIEKDEKGNNIKVDVFKNPIKIEKATFIYNHISAGPLTVLPYSRDTLKADAETTTSFTPSKFNSESVGRGSDGFPDDAFAHFKNNVIGYTYNSELAAEDHYIVLYKEMFAAPIGASIWWDNPEAKGMELVAHALNSTNLIEMLIDYGMQTAESGTAYSKRKKEVTNAGNQNIIENTKASQDHALLFADKGAVNTKHWITRKYYDEVKSTQEERMRGMVCVDLKDSFMNIQLGDTIQLASDDYASSYVVVQIEMGSKEKNASDFEEKKEEQQEQQEVTTPPPYYRIYAIPKTGDSFIAPLIPGDLFRKSGPQPAFVIDNDDPKGQGRVRVRFAWQPYKNPRTDITDADYAKLKKNLHDAEGEMYKKKKKLDSYSSAPSSYYPLWDTNNSVTVIASKKANEKDSDFDSASSDYKTACQTYLGYKIKYDKYVHKYWEDSTPWIRMVTPMATAGGGMYFQPEIGDEVMVDFENGNIDRPFVSGLLYSKNAVAPIGSNRIITSRNGHSIKFYDPDDTNLFVAGTYPGLKFLKSFGIAANDWGEDYYKAIGGIELADKLGFYRISMSSHNRNISISSPLGDVCLDAFTGITIKAPNGNVRIEGKNVDIIANNNLTLQSGENIYNGLLEQSGAAAAGRILVKTAFKDTIGNFLDLSLLRTLLEVVIRPVDGTLRIKSRRYLLLEAGDGKAAIEYDKYVQDDHRRTFTAKGAKKLTEVTYSPIVQMEKFFLDLKLQLHQYVLSYVSRFNEVVSLYSSIRADWMYSGNPPQKVYALKKSNATTTPDQILTDALGLQQQPGTNQAPSFHSSYSIDNSSADHTNKQADIEALLDKLGKAVWELKTHEEQLKTTPPNSIQHFLDTFYGLYPPSFKTAAQKDAFLTGSINHASDPLDSFFTGKTAASFTTYLDVERFSQWEHYAVRKAALNVISEAQNANSAIAISFKSDYFGVVKPTYPTGFTATAKDDSWPVFVKYVQLGSLNIVKDTVSTPDGPTTEAGFGSGALDGLIQSGIGYLGHWTEWMVWQDTSHGEIIFSNNDNESIRFNANGVTEKSAFASPQSIDAMTRSLRRTLMKL